MWGQGAPPRAWERQGDHPLILQKQRGMRRGCLCGFCKMRGWSPCLSGDSAGAERLGGLRADWAKRGDGGGRLGRTGGSAGWLAGLGSADAGRLGGLQAGLGKESDGGGRLSSDGRLRGVVLRGWVRLARGGWVGCRRGLGKERRRKGLLGRAGGSAARFMLLTGRFNGLAGCLSNFGRCLSCRRGA